MCTSRKPKRYMTVAIVLAGLAFFLYAQYPFINTRATATASSEGVQPLQRHGIQGRMAPELELSSWIDGQGKPTKRVTLAALRGKVIYLYFFQDWCPGCHSHGFPTLQSLVKAFNDDDGVALLAVQTAFEGKYTNTSDKLRNAVLYKAQVGWRLDIKDLIALTQPIATLMTSFRRKPESRGVSQFSGFRIFATLRPE